MSTQNLLANYLQWRLLRYCVKHHTNNILYLLLNKIILFY